MLKLPLQLSDYNQDISINNQSVVQEHITCDICKVVTLMTNQPVECYSPERSQLCWKRFRGYLNILSAEECQELCNNNDLLKQIETILHNKRGVITDSNKLSSLQEQGHTMINSNKLFEWKGDITTLKVDCIVNAANSDMLGCFSPNHQCIDNAIHTFAGPQLRRDCSIIMNKQQFKEPTGLAKITKAYYLPSKYIIHTVGPIVNKELTQEDINLLESCYTSCLDIANETGTIESIAFCGISTGVFGFPKKHAAMIAVSTVIIWLYKHPFTRINKVIFNTFSDEDSIIYNNTFNSMNKQFNSREVSITKEVDVNRKEPTLQEIESINKVASFFKDATHVVIGAAAGFSVDAGIDFWSTSLFSRIGFPLMSKGVKCMYETIGFNEFDSEEQKWGFLATVVQYLRIQESFPNQFDYHKSLLKLLNQYNKQYFVKTTNVDGMFERSGFLKDKIFTVQGDYSFIQCANNCTNERVDFIPYIKPILDNLDPFTRCTISSKIPKCSNCGGKMMLNVRGSDLFVEKPYMLQEEPFNNFVNDGINNGKVIFFEFGVGSNTPVHIRFPFEDWSHKNVNSMLVRINLSPHLLKSNCSPDRYVGLRLSSRQFIDWFASCL
ncbi:Uncharacterized protein QTN25_009726 [Entamoeba marina]